MKSNICIRRVEETNLFNRTLLIQGTRLHATNMPSVIDDIPIEVAEQLGHYVYLYIDPRNDSIQYIGKGVGSRAISHLSEESTSEKILWINELKKQGLSPRIEILSYNLRDSAEALAVEAAAIDLIGLKNLKNVVRGHKSNEFGRMNINEIRSRLASENAEINDPVILVRINRTFQSGMNDADVYEITRGVWKMGERRNGAKYAIAVYRGIVRGVFRIEKWHPAGSTKYNWRTDVYNNPDRWEFSGTVAEQKILDKYIFTRVQSYLGKSQNSIIYVNC